MAFSAPKGVPDYVPPRSEHLLAVREAMAAPLRLAGYGYLELPVFEDTALFARGVGETTDVVSKEMFTFVDRGERDHLDVERRVVEPQRLDTDLLELAVATGLRPLRPEHRPGVAQLDRQLPLVEPGVESGAEHPHRALRAQRQGAVGPVGEGEHLLGDDVGALPDATAEQVGVLEDRRLGVGVAGEPGGSEQGLPHRQRCAVLAPGQHVVGALRSGHYRPRAGGTPGRSRR